MTSDGVVAKFRSRAFDAEEHWLIVPIEHYANINDPTLHLAIADHMLEVAKVRRRMTTAVLSRWWRSWLRLMCCLARR